MESPIFRCSAAVEEARRKGRPIVALESSVFAQGLPRPRNAEAARRMMGAISEEGAIPAVTAIVAGEPRIGLSLDELTEFMASGRVAKAAARDLPFAVAAGAHAATTVSASLALSRRAGIEVFATGGIGGVHREPAFDESADLVELARTPSVVVCAGAKSVLDLRATVERLETLGVGVVGYQTDQFPGFLFAETGLPVTAVARDVADVVRMVQAHRRLGLPGALLVVQRPPASAALSREEVEAATRLALHEAEQAGIGGPLVTPFLLSALERVTSGRSLTVNVALLEANARLAARIAVTLASA